MPIAKLFSVESKRHRYLRGEVNMDYIRVSLKKSDLWYGHVLILELTISAIDGLMHKICSYRE